MLIVENLYWRVPFLSKHQHKSISGLDVAAGQMYLISVFTGANTNYSGSPLFGFELLRDVLLDATGGTEGTPLWRQTGLFPRVTFCDFEVLRVGQPHKYTVHVCLSLMFC